MTARPTRRPTARPTARRRPARTAAAAVGLALLLTACGAGAEEASDDAPAASGGSTSESPSAGASAEPSPSASSEPEPEPEGTVVEVVLEGGEVSPKGERVPVEVGEPVTFRITSDVAGEVHVHSVPESEFSFGPGSSERTVTVETPGLVEVELHDPYVTLVQLEAR